MNRILKYGLIGYPLSHSFSSKYFSKKFLNEKIKNTEYQSYPLSDINQICELIESGVSGLNVTIPYKEAVIPFLDQLNPACREINAVNTIKIENGHTTGYNTDVIGFESTLKEMLSGKRVDKALVLGTGGAAKAIIYVLKRIGIKYTLVSRKQGFIHYKEVSRAIINSHKLIINTTPLGMAPNENECPDLPYEYISNEHFLYDLIYNPEKTIFLKRGEEAGAKIKNGYDMLIAQAEASWTIWNQ